MRGLLAGCAVALAIAGCSSSGSGSFSGTVAASTAEVSFLADGTKTYGTLDVPAHQRGRSLAAALLIPGSGPTDRNGNETGGSTPDTLRLIAGILERRGIMTLRFDKYFTGRTGAGRYGDRPQTSTIQGDLRQAVGAYDYLARQSAADSAKLLVVGHSEGGMIALFIAATDAAKPAGLGLLEPQDLRILDLVRIQADEALSAAATQGQVTVAQARRSAMLVARAVAAFRAGQPVSTDGMAPAAAQIISELLQSSANTSYVRTWDAVAPVQLAGMVTSRTRVLVTDGTGDTNVPPSTIGPLVRALTVAGVTGPGLTLIQGINHVMHLASQPDTQAVLAPAVSTAIDQWAQPFATSR